MTDNQIHSLLFGDYGDLISSIYNENLSAKEASVRFKVTFRIIYKRLKKAGQDIGIDNLKPIDLKRSKWKFLKQQGHTISEIKSMYGLKTFKPLEFLM